VCPGASLRAPTPPLLQRNRCQWHTECVASITPPAACNQVRLDGKDVNLVGLKVVAKEGYAYDDEPAPRDVGELVSTKTGIRVCNRCGCSGVCSGRGRGEVWGACGASG
jgi:hypothetical protein